MIGLVIPDTPELRPEDDVQELWMEYGRVEALRGYLRAKKKKSELLVSIDEVDGIMGFDEYRCRRCGHPSSED